MGRRNPRKKHSEAFGFKPNEQKMEEGELKSSSSEEDETYTHKTASSTTPKEEEVEASSAATPDLLDNLDLSAIGDLFEMCKKMCGQRNLSVLLYSLMRHLRVPWRETDDLLTSIGALQRRTAHKWTKAFLSGDLDASTEEKRGGKHSDSFYDTFPEIEMEARTFTVDRCSRKNASFTSAELAKFVDVKYYEVTGEKKEGDELIRSERSCRGDIRRKGGSFEANTQRPYFEGHERRGGTSKQFHFLFPEQKRALLRGE
ncbi:unnamed protein product [Didymodactylos carnosus]|uniref:Uncharacterized protein n=1 Tax=Didymodactylos carnosus TaxID=1234261 RepID=A0A8S2UN94_9BILA|nr:unnamed protein product [Didymodactylos carnosus]